MIAISSLHIMQMYQSYEFINVFSFKPDVLDRRVDRELSFFYSRPNWDSPTPSHEGECVLYSTPRFRGAHSIAGEGLGGPNSDEGTGTVEL
jgi:hypothetical protein